jgi:hypothetical protein
MPVQTATFMPFRDMRKVVGGFEGEIFKNKVDMIALSNAEKTAA